MGRGVDVTVVPDGEGSQEGDSDSTRYIIKP